MRWTFSLYDYTACQLCTRLRLSVVTFFFQVMSLAAQRGGSLQRNLRPGQLAFLWATLLLH